MCDDAVDDAGSPLTEVTISPEGFAAVQAMYQADRADGSAIFGVSIQLVGIMVTYAAVGFAVLGSDSVLVGESTIRACIAVPLWGLAAYVVIANATMTARVASINHLEGILREQFRGAFGSGSEPVLGSDAGDWASNVTRQPKLLRGVTLMSFMAAFAGVVGLTIYSLASVWKDWGHWTIPMIFLYLIFAFLVFGGFAYTVWGGFEKCLKAAQHTRPGVVTIVDRSYGQPRRRSRGWGRGSGR